MQYVEIPFEDATLPQLRQAAEMFGIEPSRSDNTNSLKSKVRAVFQGDKLRLPQAVPLETPQGTPPVNPAIAAEQVAAPPAQNSAAPQGTGNEKQTRFPMAKDDPICRVILQNQERDGKPDDKPVTLGCNGELVTINRGVEVDLPWRFFLSLKNAERISYTQVEGEEDMIETRFPAYPFSVVRFPSDDEVAAWEAVTSKISIGA